MVTAAVYNNATDYHVACLNKVTFSWEFYIYRYNQVAVSFDPRQETNNFGTSNSVFSSVKIRAIISFKVISWYKVKLLLTNYVLNRLTCSTELSKYSETCFNCSLVYSCAVTVLLMILSTGRF